MIYRRGLVLGAAVWLLMQPASLLAQQLPRGTGWGARMVMEPVILAHGGFSALCNPRAAGRATWGVEQIEKAVQPTEAQRSALDDLKAAATKAADLSTGACPKEIPRSSNDRLAFLAKRLGALREATMILVPAVAAFHASLSDEQKVRLDVGPRRWRWPRQ